MIIWKWVSYCILFSSWGKHSNPQCQNKKQSLEWAGLTIELIPLHVHCWTIMLHVQAKTLVNALACMHSNSSGSDSRPVILKRLWTSKDDPSGLLILIILFFIYVSRLQFPFSLFHHWCTPCCCSYTTSFCLQPSSRSWWKEYTTCQLHSLLLYFSHLLSPPIPSLPQLLQAHNLFGPTSLVQPLVRYSAILLFPILAVMLNLCLSSNSCFQAHQNSPANLSELELSSWSSSVWLSSTPEIMFRVFLMTFPPPCPNLWDSILVSNSYRSLPLFFNAVLLKIFYSALSCNQTSSKII